MNASADQKPGPIEARLSMVVMIVLAAVAVGIFVRQYRFNPAVEALRPQVAPQARPALPDENATLVPLAPGLVAFSPPERFGSDTLYEKIDGRADLYLASGFVSLKTQRFTTRAATGQWVELFVYDMTTPENAFTVFSMQRRDGAQPDAIAPNAYRTQNALFMTQGRYYLEIIGTDASAGLKPAVSLIGRAFVKTHGGRATTRAPGLDFFPEAGRASGSLQRIAANAFGIEALDRVYSCEYRIDGVSLTAFVSERPDPAAASALADQYRRTLLSYGAVVADATVPVKGAVVLKMFDTYEIVFSRGRYLAGVHEAKKLDAATTLARRLDEHLKGK